MDDKKAVEEVVLSKIAKIIFDNTNQEQESCYKIAEEIVSAVPSIIDNRIKSGELVYTDEAVNRIVGWAISRFRWKYTEEQDADHRIPFYNWYWTITDSGDFGMPNPLWLRKEPGAVVLRNIFTQLIRNGKVDYE